MSAGSLPRHEPSGPGSPEPAHSGRPIGFSRPRDPNRPWYRHAQTLFPAEPGRWIDLGCGQGEFTEQVADGRAPIPIVLDRSQANVAAARSNGAAALTADLNLPLPLASGSLDGGALIEVIEHIATAERLVDEIARVLRPGGWLIVTTPNVAHLTYRLRALFGRPPKQEGYHLRFFTEKTLRNCLESRGFRIEARASFGKQALLTKLYRLAGRGPDFKFRYRVPRLFEGLLAQHFVWRLRRS
jgi:SAM-dependent methyltransferase